MSYSVLKNNTAYSEESVSGLHEKLELRLIEELKCGNINAFNSLFESYSSRLYHFAYGFFKSKEEAEELVQDVFIKIWENRSNLKPESNFKSYLFTIAFNQIKKYYRSKALLNQYLDFQKNKEDYNEDYFSEMDYSSLKELVDHLIELMPPRRRAVFMKSRYEEKSVKEISQEMNITESTVENHLNQALRYLRTNLQKENLTGIIFFILFIQ